nr:hypothetical protein [Walnut Creek virus]
MMIPNHLFIILNPRCSVIGPIALCRDVVRMSPNQKTFSLMVHCRPIWLPRIHQNPEEMKNLIRMYTPPWIRVTWIASHWSTQLN